MDKKSQKKQDSSENDVPNQQATRSATGVAPRPTPGAAEGDLDTINEDLREKHLE